MFKPAENTYIQIRERRGVQTRTRRECLNLKWEYTVEKKIEE